MKLRLALASLALLAACGPGEKQFGHAYARAACQQYETCFSLEFNAEYGSLRSCYVEQDAVWEANAPALAFCDYDRKQAADCLAELAKAERSCDPADASRASTTCSTVYFCAGGLDTAE